MSPSHIFVDYGTAKRGYYLTTSSAPIISREGDGPRLREIPTYYHRAILVAETDGTRISKKFRSQIRNGIVTMLTWGYYPHTVGLCREIYERKIIRDIVVVTVEAAADKSPEWGGEDEELVESIMEGYAETEKNTWDFEDRCYYTYLLLKEHPHINKVLWSDMYEWRGVVYGLDA